MPQSYTFLKLTYFHIVKSIRQSSDQILLVAVQEKLYSEKMLLNFYSPL